jgi:hypothetical protein
MSPSPSRSADSPDSPMTGPMVITPPRVSPLFMAPQSSTSPEPPPPSQTPGSSSAGSPSLPPEDLLSSTSTPDGPSGPGPVESGDTPSTGKGVKLSKSGLRTGLGVGFRQVCKLVAGLAADQYERDEGLWLPDEDDVQDVSTPAANIVYRRLPDEAKGGDVIDLFALGLALVGYVGKNLMHRAEIRTARRLQAAQGVTAEEEAAL